MHAHLLALEAVRVDRHLGRQLGLDRHLRRRRGRNAGDDDVLLAVARRRFAQREGVDRAGVLAPAGGLGQRRDFGAVVGAVAEDQQTEQRLLAVAAVVDGAQHRAEVGALAVGLAEFFDLDLVGIAGEPIEDYVDLLFVGEPLERRGVVLEDVLKVIPARLVVQLIDDGHAFGTVDGDDNQAAFVRRVVEGQRRPQDGDEHEQTGAESQQGDRQQAPPPRLRADEVTAEAQADGHQRQQYQQRDEQHEQELAQDAAAGLGRVEFVPRPDGIEV